MRNNLSNETENKIKVQKNIIIIIENYHILIIILA